MKNYVAGFAFHDDMVVLILKEKPPWQAGLYNGVGGKIEKGEDSHDAMYREFREETGVRWAEWKHFATQSEVGKYRVDFFFAKSSIFGNCTRQEEERIAHCRLDSLPTNVIPNLNWLIPLALYSMTRELVTPLMFIENKTTKEEL